MDERGVKRRELWCDGDPSKFLQYRKSETPSYMGM